MSQLVEKLNVLLATSFSMYLKTHFFHWNVKGRDFYEYHKFLEGIYTDIWESVDSTAEEIKALEGIAYGSLTQYQSLSNVKDATEVPSSREMISQIHADNLKVIAVLNEVHALATEQNEGGLLNYIEARLDAHKKHGWMLKASMESDTNEERVYILKPE